MKNKADWLGWSMQLVFGLILGGVLGVIVWLRRHNGTWLAEDRVLPFLAGCALIGAGLTSHYGDRIFYGLFQETSYRVIPPDAPERNAASRCCSVLLGLGGVGCVVMALRGNFGLF